MRFKAKQLELSIPVPRPVRPAPPQQHGFFGSGFVRQHMMIDERWTSSSLQEEYQTMSELLQHQLKFNKLEKAIGDKKRFQMHQTLRKECREGRNHLSYIRDGADKKMIRNLLTNHRYMQRLYKHMPLHMVEENINQRTFVMRKERDRLQCHLEKLKKEYEEKLLECGIEENRLRYQNEFILQEEIDERQMKKKIANSDTRLEAAQTIHSTYKKIIKILHHDEIFYEPILHSLDNDIKDQEQFIAHILFLGAPAIKRFKELSEQHRIMSDKSRKSLRSSLQEVVSATPFDGSSERRNYKSASQISYKVRRYVRETRSMTALKVQLEEVEKSIKNIKFATLSSQETDTYPRIKTQMVNNLKMISKLNKDTLQNQTLDTKMKCGSVLKEVLMNNLSDDTIKRWERLKALNDAIKAEDDFQAKTLAHIKHHSDYFVLLRFTLWNIHDIMRHVGPRRMPFIKYPVKYLSLPLLKYEMLVMQACPPDPFEVNIPTLMRVVQQKLKLLMQAFDKKMLPKNMQELKTMYCNSLIDVAHEADGDSVDSQDQLQIINNNTSRESDIIEKFKISAPVPNRKQIKLASAKILESSFKKETKPNDAVVK